MKPNEKLTDSLLKEYHRQGTSPDYEFMDAVLEQVKQDIKMKTANNPDNLSNSAAPTSPQAASPPASGNLQGGWPLYAVGSVAAVFMVGAISIALISKKDNEVHVQAAVEYDAAKSVNSAKQENAGYVNFSPKMEEMEKLIMDPIQGGVLPQNGGNKYGELTDNIPQLVAKNNTSTFSVDVDTASYTQFRKAVNQGREIFPNSVRIEEWINYFQYDYPQPVDGQPFSINVDASDSPWSHGKKLVRIGLQGKAIKADNRKSANLVFLVDTSGSMSAPDKFPLLQQSLLKLMKNLNEKDTISIVTYAGSSGVALAPTAVDDAGKRKIEAVLTDLRAQGSTHGSAGLNLAYKLAQDSFIKDGVNRVVLATDGDFNVGVTGPDELTALVKEKAQAGVEVSVLGFGHGNLNDRMLESITNNGNGNYYYIDSQQESHRVLTQKLTGTIQTIAKDVKIQAIFNADFVKTYRLIGYANRILNKEDFDNDKVDAGEIGAGHSVTALYEVEMLPKAEQEGEGAFIDVKLRYKQPKGKESALIVRQVFPQFATLENASKDLKFSASVALLGMLHRNSEYKGFGNKELALSLAEQGLTGTDADSKQEFIDLVKKSQLK